jgi:uridine kinase
MLRIPTPYKSAAKNIENQPKYLEVFKEAENQAEQLSSSYIADLNEHLLSGEIEDIIKADEKFQKDMIDAIVDTIIKSDTVRVVLIAGPSSSGKTTFARRLALELDAKGRGSLPVSIDDYYRNRDDIQADRSGEKDYETLAAIDTQKLEEDMLTLLAGGTADLPEFDFVTGVRKEQPKKTNIGDELIIIEGIHGLNDKLLTGLDRKLKFKIFVSPLTALNFDTRSVVLPEEIRLLRRLARDKRTRGFSFSDTFARWFSVRKGEYKYILPYQESADVMFNTMLLYEPLVLKKYCYEELQRIPNTDSGYVRAQSMLKFLNYFLSLEDESAIPKDSLVREFIGGGLVQ